MNPYKFLITLLLLLSCGNAIQAQVAKDFVYVDSSLMYPDSKDTVAAPAEDEEQEDTVSKGIKYRVDTSLVFNELSLSRDSIRLLKNAKQFAYAKKLDSLLKEYQKQLQQSESMVQPEQPSFFEQFLSSGVTKFIFWSLACFFVVFIIYKLFFTEGFLQRASAKNPVNLLAEDDADLIGKQDYDKKLALAINNKNYRLATRYLYLQSIQKLNAAGAISFTADKTNSEYLNELTGKPYKPAFTSLTLNYEYVWYGEFLIEEPAFIQLQERFKKFNTQFKNI